MMGNDNVLRGADLVITGEGKTDSQTKGGKLCSVVLDKCKKNNIPLILVSGAISGDLDSFLDDYLAVFSISSGQSTTEKQSAESKRDMMLLIENIARLIKFKIQKRH